MEATVTSYTNGSIKRRVVLSEHEQTPPLCCGYSENGSGLPCLHSIAVLCKKHGASSIHRFISKRHLTAAWREIYEGATFLLPDQSDVEDVITQAKRKVINGNNSDVPVALPPRRGCPFETAGKRRKSWYERGRSAKKRHSSTCSLCHTEGHTARQCELRHLFEDP